MSEKISSQDESLEILLESYKLHNVNFSPPHFKILNPLMEDKIVEGREGEY